MTTFLKKDIPSTLFILSITVFGLCLALLLVGENSEKGKLGLYFTMASMLLTAISLFMTISKRNEKLSKSINTQEQVPLNKHNNLKNSNSSTRKKGASAILIIGLIILGAFITLIVVGGQTEKQRLGAILGAISALCLSASMYLSILKMNKKAQ